MHASLRYDVDEMSKDGVTGVIVTRADADMRQINFVDAAANSLLKSIPGYIVTVSNKIGSTTGAPEAAYAQAFGKGISLSEQQLVDCAGTFNNFECNGGLPSQAFEYIKYNGGLETEDAYPYTGKDGVCKYSSENVGVQVLDSVNITLGAEDELRHAVAFARPVGVAFEVVNGFRVYKGGVYTSNKCGSSPLATMSYSLSMDDDYEKLIKGMNPLRVVLDNESCKNVAVIQVGSANKYGILLEVVQIVTDVNLVVTKSYML
ncbi:hypothetical protein OROHE_011391 [Orobanche hederae]